MKLHPLVKTILLCSVITLSSCTYTTKLGDKLLPDSEYNTLVVKANAAMHDGEWAKAATFYEKAWQLKQDVWDLRLKQAQAYQNNGKLAQAFNTYQLIIDAKSTANDASDTVLKAAKESQAKLGFKSEPVSAPQGAELTKATLPDPSETQEQDDALKAKAEEALPQETQKHTIVDHDSNINQASSAQTQRPETPSTASNQSELVMDEVSAWVNAWERKNINAYFAHYADGFSGEWNTARAWRQSRKDKIQKAKQIKISLSEIQMNDVGAEAVEVSFKQHYQSGTYQDSGKKTLTFKKMNGHWRITQEAFK